MKPVDVTFSSMAFYLVFSDYSLGRQMKKISLVCFSLLVIFMSSYVKSAVSDPMTLYSAAFKNHDLLAPLYTCDGKNISPELHWKNIPTKTQSFALIVTDPDAPSGTFYHWVVYNIPINAKALPRDSRHLPPSAVAGKNSWGSLQYNGPCPPKGSTHTYIFTLYAVDVNLNILSGMEGEAILKVLINHVLEKNILTARYGR
jgi:Raf kinase inhibitor-like YbhB/YbcL family protein